MNHFSGKGSIIMGIYFLVPAGNPFDNGQFIFIHVQLLFTMRMGMKTKQQRR